VNGTGDYDSHCYNSGLKNMEEGKCYMLNPERIDQIQQYMNDDAAQTYWWVETSCGDVVAESSSSVEGSSASEMSSSAGGIVESSSAGQNPYLALRGMPQSRLSVSLSGRTLLIEGGQATVEVFDLQGRPLARFSQVSGAVELAKFNAGSYILRVKSGTQVQNRKITLK
jgi:hypothetical protein